MPIERALAQPAAPAQSGVKTGGVALAPQPPVPKSPIESFRKLLSMDIAEREKLLAGKTPQARQSFETKLKEYLALPASEREVRLKLVELRWYLAPLMKLAPLQRAANLAMVPEADRPLVEERLNQWDQLPPDLQQKLLTNQMTMQYVMRLEGSTPAQREAALKGLTDAQKQKLEADLGQWRQLPEDQRRKMLGHFQQFFELNEKEKEKVLRVLSDSERQAMEKTLQAFQKLPKPQRDACIAGFRKFSNLPAAERQFFLQNAERWHEMNPQDRQAWRDLVRKVPEMPP